jgi:hypothetical protein
MKIIDEALSMYGNAPSRFGSSSFPMQVSSLPAQHIHPYLEGLGPYTGKGLLEAVGEFQKGSTTF